MERNELVNESKEMAAYSGVEALWGQIAEEVRQLRHEAFGEDLMIRHKGLEDSCRQILRERVAEFNAATLSTHGELMSREDRAELQVRLEALLGSGPMEEFLKEDVEDVYVFGPSTVVLRRSDGSQEILDQHVFPDESSMTRHISHLAATQGQTSRRFDHSEPLLDLRLRTGERIFSVMSVSEMPFIVVRRHLHVAVTLDGLVQNGTIPVEAGEFLRAAASRPSPANILIAGALSAGKTTLLRALLNEVGQNEIIATIEQTFELFLEKSHKLTVAVETRDPNSEEGGKTGEITIETLARRFLRSGADRIIIGELRGAEALQFLLACGTGSDGSMCTIHAATPATALHRLVTYSLRDQFAPPLDALSYEVGEAIHLVVHVVRHPVTGSREVNAISEVCGWSPNGGFDMVNIFGRRGLTAPLEYLNSPKGELLRERLELSGWKEPKLGASTFLASSSDHISPTLSSSGDADLVTAGVSGDGA